MEEAPRRVVGEESFLRRESGRLLRAPPEPAMPEDAEHNPERYAQCMRLLWLAASMKSFDVLVALLPTDQQNLEICRLVADMLPLLQSVHKHQRAPPQVLIALGDEAALADLSLAPQPFVVPMHSALPSLVCEVLHPMAHWSGPLVGGAHVQGSPAVLNVLGRAAGAPARVSTRPTVAVCTDRTPSSLVCAVPPVLGQRVSIVSYRVLTMFKPHTRSTNASKCSATGSALQAADVGAPSTFDIFIRDADGRPCDPPL